MGGTYAIVSSIGGTIIITITTIITITIITITITTITITMITIVTF